MTSPLNRTRGRYRISLCVLMLSVAGCSTTVAGSGSALSGTALIDASRSAGGTSTDNPDTRPGTVSADPTTSGTEADSTAPNDHERWLPSEENPDPSIDIPGIYAGPEGLYSHRYHFSAPDRVAYDRFPPVGGPHDPVWAACDGVVYDKPVRNENMVHSLEHGAVWIAYNPDTLSSDDLFYLRGLVSQVSYLVMTPYPNLPTALSLQSWAHQLALDSASDPRLDEFLLALLRNPYLTPEPNGTCQQPHFDVVNPPAFDSDPLGPDAIPLDYEPPTSTATTTG